MPYLERNMVGMFKQLDSWVKGVLPVLPYSSLQDSILHLLQVKLKVFFLSDKLNLLRARESRLFEVVFCYFFFVETDL